MVRCVLEIPVVVIKVGIVNFPNSQNSIAYVVVEKIRFYIFIHSESVKAEASCTELFCQ